MCDDKDRKSNDATEDDDFGDFEAPEDEAPESVQAIASPSPWAIFPDLLRVQSNQSSSHEEPESGNSLHHSRLTARPGGNDQPSIRGAIGRETGAIPKQRALDPPDISLLTNSSQPKLDLCSSTPRPTPRDTMLPGSSSSAMQINRQSNLLMTSPERREDSDVNAQRIAQLERDLKALQTQKAVLQQQLLQKDTQIRALQSVPNVVPSTSHQQPSPPQSIQDVNAALTEHFERFRSTVESSVRQLEERLNSLETRLPRLISSAVGNSANSFSGADATQQPNHLNAANHDIAGLIQEQRRNFEEERRLYLLTFSEVLKKAAESISSHESSNGPKPPKSEERR